MVVDSRGAGTVLYDVLKMLAAGIEAREKLPRARARPGTVLVLNADEVQSARMGYSRRWVYRSFYFGRSALEDIYRGLGLAKMPSFLSAAIADAHLTAQFRSLHEALDRPGCASQILECLIVAFARMLNRCSAATRTFDAGRNGRARSTRSLQ